MQLPVHFLRMPLGGGLGPRVGFPGWWRWMVGVPPPPLAPPFWTPSLGRLQLQTMVPWVLRKSTLAGIVGFTAWSSHWLAAAWRGWSAVASGGNVTGGNLSFGSCLRIQHILSNLSDGVCTYTRTLDDTDPQL